MADIRLEASQCQDAPPLDLGAPLQPSGIGK